MVLSPGGKNPPTLANCCLAPLPQHTNAHTVLRRCWLLWSQRWSWQRGLTHPSPTPSREPPAHSWGDSAGVSPLSPASRNPLCPHLDSFAFTTEPLEWAQGAVLAPRSLQDGPSSGSPCPGAAPTQAARTPASVSPLGESSPLQPVLAICKQPLTDAARAAHD